MDAYVASLLAPVLRDVDACAELRVRVEDDYQPPAGYGPPSADVLAYLWMPNGSGTGLRIPDGLPAHEQLAAVSNRVHEAVVEGRWAAGLSTSWPACPWHPDSHPLSVGLRGTEVVWACPNNQQVACPVGGLTC